MTDSQNPGARPNRFMYSSGLTPFCCHAASLTCSLTVALLFAFFSAAAAFVSADLPGKEGPVHGKPQTVGLVAD